MTLNNQSSKLPHFLIIGAGKSGTTALEAYLNQHPDIYLPAIKEPNFFAYEKHHAEDFNDQETIDHFNNSITDWDSYLQLFKDAANDQVIGEISNTYLCMSESLANIKNHLPDTKLIAVIRQPAERIYSRYMHLLRVDKAPEGNFDEDVLDKSSIWWQRADLINEGFYYQHLKRFYEAFDSKQIKVFLHEDLLFNRDKTLADICTFLDVDPSFTFNSTTAYNKSGVVKNQFFNKLVGNKSVLIKGLKGISPAVYSKIKGNRVLKDTIERLRNKNIKKKKMSGEVKKQITNIYKEDIKNLEGLIERDLSSWLN
ncbi:sulfotransferase family protein [Reichenbachiella ulvae]|uniref:Sulfotransferase n=1 Tax=Reichenbachiella ulvae TaxID=2980104 RepID=A0ABT3CN99_9BACT|nr:sulfotransferase [Reichenbachiella ulvae]MCV9385021.1 sulfotransferase [Reichenbachiella ulvae]